MGLNTTHGAWDGTYSSFYAWRKQIAFAAGLPPLELMEGFYAPYTSEPDSNLAHLDKRLPIKWESLKKTPLFVLLTHSDCDGHITWRKCKNIADELEKLLPLLPVDKSDPSDGDYWVRKTQLFIDGCRLAHSRKENLEFH